jgi:hypothetical protein
MSRQSESEKIAKSFKIIGNTYLKQASILSINTITIRQPQNRSNQSREVKKAKRVVALDKCGNKHPNGFKRSDLIEEFRKSGLPISAVYTFLSEERKNGKVSMEGDKRAAVWKMVK